MPPSRYTCVYWHLCKPRDLSRFTVVYLHEPFRGGVSQILPVQSTEGFWQVERRQIMPSFHLPMLALALLLRLPMSAASRAAQRHRKTVLDGRAKSV